MQRTYLFYDIETSGLNKCFDQVLQFAAIRTDLKLNELERHEILVKLNADTVPSPQAALVHQLSLAQLQTGICEYAAIREIHRLFNTPGTISIGYNTLGFDDEFLRFSFYRNLLPPYTHQYANNCGRVDLYPITVMYYLFKPEVLSWPIVGEKISLKLEHLNAQNKLVDGRAHDAVHDVVTTLALARLLQQEQKMWEYLHNCFVKKIDAERCEQLSVAFAEYRQALLIDGSYGAENFYSYPAICLGIHSYYKNQSLWLQLDSTRLTETTVATIPETTFICRKRFGEQPLLLPFVERFTRYLSSKRCELVAANINWLQRNHGLFQEIIRYYKEYQYPVVPNLDVDAALYQNGFLNDQEQLMCKKFHEVDLPSKVEMLEQFSNPNLRTQALRVLGRNYPEALSDKYRKEFESYLHKDMVDYRNQARITPQEVLAEIQQLQESGGLDLTQQKLLTELAVRYN